MFIKPIYAVYLDYREKSGQGINRKLLVIIGAFGVLFSFIIFIFSLELLVIFAIFLGINFTFVSIVDVTIDKFIVEQRKNEKIKDKNALFMQLGAVIGAILPNIFYFVLMSDKTSPGQWNLFFIVGIIAIVPLLPIVFLLKNEISSEEEIIPKNVNNIQISIKAIALMSVFLFFAYSENLYNWLLEPWALDRLGSASDLFSIFMIIFILFNAIGLIIASKISHKYDRKKVLILSTVFYGGILAIAPFMNIYIFFILVSITQIISGFFLINMITIMIDLSEKKVVVFQVMASFAILAKVIFIPLGTALSTGIATEVIIMIAGILTAFSVVPLYFIEYENS
jgi:MFS family permease